MICKIHVHVKNMATQIFLSINMNCKLKNPQIQFSVDRKFLDTFPWTHFILLLHLMNTPKRNKSLHWSQSIYTQFVYKKNMRNLLHFSEWASLTYLAQEPCPKSNGTVEINLSWNFFGSNFISYYYFIPSLPYVQNKRTLL